MRWIAAIAAVLAPGCFYVEPINQRPSAEIVRDAPANLPIRGGGAIAVSAKWSDPDGDGVTFAWSVTACSSADVCLQSPFLTGTEETFPIAVPADFEGAPTTRKIAIHLDVIDSHGAIARPGQDLLLDVMDQAPTVSLRAEGVWGQGPYPVTLPITVHAMKHDADGDPVTLTWDPPFATGTDTSKSAWGPVVTSSDGSEMRTFTPDVDGHWSIHVTADDGLGTTGDASDPITVDPDQPPCLGTTDPGLVTGTIVVDQLRRFSVLTVDDDIDIYPAPSSSSPLGAAAFHWSLASPASSGALTALTTDDNNVVIDPAQFAPGDQLDLRVEISDATVRPSPCDPSTAQCSATGDACLQRQTWHLEIR